MGVDISLETLRQDFDAVCLAIGARNPREVLLPGRHLDGIVLAMDYLPLENRRQAGRPVNQPIVARDKHVVVLGGGDTGADCVATALRQGARQVVQIGINSKRPLERPQHNPWPEYPLTYLKTYAQQEGGIEEFSVNTTGFIDANGDGHVDYIGAERVEWTYDSRGKRIGKTVLDPDLKIPADLVLIAIGFRGIEVHPLRETDLQLRANGTLQVNEMMMTNLPRVFAAGDANRGPTLVVWAIGEGRDVARHIDLYLTGKSKLRPSLRTTHPPIGV